MNEHDNDSKCVFAFFFFATLFFAFKVDYFDVKRSRMLDPLELYILEKFWWPFKPTPNTLYEVSHNVALVRYTHNLLEARACIIFQAPVPRDRYAHAELRYIDVGLGSTAVVQPSAQNTLSRSRMRRSWAMNDVVVFIIYGGCDHNEVSLVCQISRGFNALLHGEIFHVKQLEKKRRKVHVVFVSDVSRGASHNSSSSSRNFRIHACARAHTHTRTPVCTCLLSLACFCQTLN